MNIRHILRINAIAGFAAILVACGPASPDETSSTNKVPKTPPVPAATVDELASGKKVYETNCMICHKSDGTGGKVSIEGGNLDVEDLTAKKVRGFSDEKLISYIMNGTEDEGMPAFKEKLSEGELRDVVRYIRSELQRADASRK